MNARLSAAAVSSNTAQATMLAALAQLSLRVRACPDASALGFLMVNDSHALAPYRQAALWLREPGQQKGRIIALSGLAVPDPHAPFNQWLARMLDQHVGTATTIPAPLLRPCDGDDALRWAEYLPAHAWWLPLPLGASGAASNASAGLLLLRDEPWQGPETTVLGLAADTYAHAWRALRAASAKGSATRHWRSVPARRKLLAACVLVLTFLLWPIRQSVLAPAEVMARAPEAVRAPLQGVVDSIAVTPNQSVKKGQLLAALDARELRGRLESARQSLAVAEAEWRRGQQQALFDARSKSDLALLQGKRDQAAADVDYYAQSLARTQLHAERDGVALFDDPSDWIGKPVALGERIMLVADPQDTELEIQLPIADAIDLPQDASVRLFLNAAPSSPIAASVLRVSYRASPAADGTLAYRVRARFQDPASTGEQLRVGLKGTAKLYGERTVLALYLLRRPLATARIWLGL
ncbi:HlyD family efflux transporter periplasmic adaptor subunit [Comamonas sp. Tr-654]|uniref:efflux RND transporter periplasmic adaptor subunit n=1 Tax=Comamonas sp. Tr-654 TaxID=2608341 RepID=UPI001421AAED|nr:HlyD family efflux transporter periplasmic adaptor subunit [Comamonas sp. Tr-654]NIF86049.1 HlyD family efflux transporter periplasmic adaptor subunit [Comamonas sp. Tr-654]